MRILQIFLISLILSLAACNDAGDSGFAWATVDLSDVQRLMEAKAEKQNPELAQKIKAIRGSYDQKRDIKDAIYRFTRSAKEQCKNVKNQPLSEADKIRGISAYDACLFDIDKLPDVVELQKQWDDIDAQGDRLTEAKKQLRKVIEQRSEQLLEEFSKEHYALVVSSRQQIFYNKTGKVLDVTESFKAFVKDKNLDFSLATIEKN